MWPAIAFLVGAIPAFVFFLLLRSARKKLRKLRRLFTLMERDLAASERQRDDERERNIDVQRAAAEHVQSFRDQIKGEIKEAARLGADDSVLRMVNAGLERMRKLSEANGGNEDAELRRRHRAATVDNRASGD